MLARAGARVDGLVNYNEGCNIFEFLKEMEVDFRDNTT
jgi:hypothetical protein